MASLPKTFQPLIHDLILDDVRCVTPDSRVHLYAYMKTLAGRILLSVFISSLETQEESQEAVRNE